ncbi:Uncharacterised protein [Serratia plymuthica]|uniref:Uncharacterized protein n=1 Tax=Serratia plymuthica TaxID=82996 RepID=A0A2X4UU05_SERPL|nr:Uncharacterised protein [Serratia plymuthica]
MEFDEQGPTSVPSDAKMVWGARQNGDWLRAYEDLVTEDIDLPELEAKTLILEGKRSTCRRRAPFTSVGVSLTSSLPLAGDIRRNILQMTTC